MGCYNKIIKGMFISLCFSICKMHFLGKAQKIKQQKYSPKHAVHVYVEHATME